MHQEALAERIGQLARMIEDEGDELDAASLRLAAQFLCSEHGLGAPQIGATPAGEIQAAWKFPGDALVVMDFLPENLVRFAALATVGQDGRRPLPPSGVAAGVAEQARAMGEIREFLALLESS